MVSVRAFLVLVATLSLATPAVSLSVQRELSPLTSSSMSLAAPATGAQLVRAVTKTDKTFGFGFAIAPAQSALLLPIDTIELAPAFTPDAPNLDLTGPPLAPRPPPSR